MNQPLGEDSGGSGGAVHFLGGWVGGGGEREGEERSRSNSGGREGGEEALE